jgi:hypothetical protein
MTKVGTKRSCTYIYLELDIGQSRVCMLMAPNAIFYEAQMSAIVLQGIWQDSKLRYVYWSVHARFTVINRDRGS